MVYEAMKRVMKKSLEYKHSVHIKNLYGNLKKDGIGTTTVEELCKRICRTLPEHRTRALVKIIIRWKLQDAHDQLRQTQRENTATWRKEKETIANAGLAHEFNQLWRREITKYAGELKENMTRKL